METYQGLILAERSAGDRGKFVDILTDRNTVQEVYVRGGKKLASASVSATQQFSYANFSVQQGRNGLVLNSAEPIRIFYRLRESLSRLSLAVYFCELVRFTIREQKQIGDNCEAMRLMLNTLHYLEENTREEGLLKTIFEFRLMTEIGMMPDVVACRSCQTFLPKRLYFSIEEGCFCCATCNAFSNQETPPVLLSAAALQALRHIVFADFKRLYNFRLGEENLAALQQCAEAFTCYHLGLRLRTLEFYHAMKPREESTYEST